jgi:hypothetical protein
MVVAPAPAIEPYQLPGDTEAVLTINVRQLLGSDLAKTNKNLVDGLKAMLDMQLADEGVQRYLEKIDFDPFRDLTRITAATSGGKVPDFVVLEGKFNAEKIQATGEEASRDHADVIKAVKIAGQNAFEITVPANDRPVFAGMVGKDKLVATTTKDGFADAVGRLTGGKRSTIKKELNSLVDMAEGKQSLSLVTTGPALARMVEDAPVPNIEALQGVLQGVSALNIAIKAEKNVNFELAVNSASKEAADQMVKLSSVGLAAAKLILKKKADGDAKYVPALEIVNTMKVTSQGNNFVLRGEMTAQTLSKVLKDLPK